MEREGILKPIIGSESLHEISNDNWVTVVNFVTPKNLIVQSTVFRIAEFVNTFGLIFMERHTVRMITDHVSIKTNIRYCTWCPIY
jgi:hypothetical protein